MARVLVTGMAGGLAHLVADRLVALGHEVIGVDYRPVPRLTGELSRVTVVRASYNKTAIEDVFRKYAFDAVLHLGRVGNLRESAGKRFDLNVVGSQKIMTMCVQHGVKELVVLSTFHIYGAHPSNHIPISEDEPLRAGLDFPQLADAIQLDSMATSWVFRHREVRTVVLRPTNLIGPTLQNTMSKFLRLARVPSIMGFDPMMQFVHESDMADAIVAAATSDRSGVYNVGGPAVLPWTSALQLAGARTYPIPSPVGALAMKLFTGFPQYLLNFFKYPCVISDAAFRSTFAWSPRVGIEDTLWSTVESARTAQRR